jgi:hypothetical protein
MRGCGCGAATSEVLDGAVHADRTNIEIISEFWLRATKRYRNLQKDRMRGRV